MGLTGRVDPADVARRLGIRVDMIDFQGKLVQEITVGNRIGVRRGMNLRKRRWAIAHGLGHAIMHGGMNQVFLHMADWDHAHYKSEIEAEHFARGLMLDVGSHHHVGDARDAESASHYGVPVEKIFPRNLRGAE